MKLISTMLIAAVAGMAAAGCSDDKRVNSGTGSSTSSMSVPENTAVPGPNAPERAPVAPGSPAYTPSPDTPTPSPEPSTTK